MFNLENVTSNSGFLISIGGILLVFFGLVLINLSVLLMNYLFRLSEKKSKKKEIQATVEETPIESDNDETSEIPPEHVAVIFAAVELYRRLHFDIPKGGITVRHGQESNNSWKMGQVYGQRL